MGDVTLTWWLLLLVVGACLLPAVRIVLNGRGDLFEPALWSIGYFAVLFVLRPVYDITLGSEFLGEFPFDAPTRRAFQLSLVYACLGLVGFLLGYYAGAARGVARLLPRMPIAWNAVAAQILSFALALIGCGVFAIHVISFGGIAGYLSGKAQILTESGQGYQLLGVSLITVGFALRLSLARKGSANLLADWGFAGILLVIGFASGSKGAFLLPLLIWTVATHYLRHRIRLSKIVGLASLTVLMFPVFNVYRHAPSLLEVTPEIVEIGVDGAASELLVRHGMSRFYGIDSLTVIVRDTPAVMEYQFGQTVYPLFVAWIPRQLWEDKPVISFGKIFAEQHLGDFFVGTGVSGSPTILGEAYLNWHVAGMLAIAFLAGFLVRVIYVWLIQENFGPPAVFVYSQLFLYLFTFWEASIAGLIAERLAAFVLLLLVVLIAGARPGALVRVRGPKI